MRQTMRNTRVTIALLALLAVFAPLSSAHAEIKDRILGKPDASVKMEEYASLTCPHCADFTVNTLPDLEKNFVETGKVKIIFHDYPLDGPSLKAAALARCMPPEQYYPFIKTLYESQATWAVAANPEPILVQYAKLGGLDEVKAKACLNDNALFDAIIDARQVASDKLSINSTPTFIITAANGTVQKIEGAKPKADFTAALDRAVNSK